MRSASAAAQVIYQVLGVSKKKVAVRAEQSRKKGAHKETVAEPALQLDMGAFLSALNSMLRATMVERAAFCFRAYDKKNKGEVDRMQIFRMACDRFQATPCSSCAAWDDRAASDRTGIGSGLQTATTDCADGGMRMTAAVECALHPFEKRLGPNGRCDHGRAGWVAAGRCRCRTRRRPCSGRTSSSARYVLWPVGQHARDTYRRTCTIVGECHAVGHHMLLGKCAGACWLRTLRWHIRTTRLTPCGLVDRRRRKREARLE